VVDALLQVRGAPDPKYLLGRGKLEDINLRAMQKGASMLIVDRDLSPSQARHIGEAASLKVLDRTQLILDIFAQRARSGDGKLQVELAQLQYLLPRLVRADPSLSRLAGGIGGRGPGETKLEMDRRRVRARIAFLARRIDELSHGRRTRRRRRERRGLPIVSIVGYTNAGKSSLLNALTGASVPVEDKLFATLDPTSRRLRFPEEREVIVTDTVGFIRDLPPDLAQAFRATLEELGDASVLLHVADAADPDRLARLEAVEDILASLGLGDVPRLMVWNKVDLLSPLERAVLLRARPGVAVSALTGTGLPGLLSAARAKLAEADHDGALLLEAAPRQLTEVTAT
jgi:GTP-binding protein HflX